MDAKSRRLLNHKEASFTISEALLNSIDLPADKISKVTSLL